MKAGYASLQIAPGKSMLKTSVLLLGLLAASVLTGLLVATEAYTAIALMAALAVGPALLCLPRVGLWTAFVGATCAAGLIDLYLPMLQPLKWGLALLSIALGIVSVFKEFFSSRSKVNVEQSGLLVWLAFFFVYAVFSEVSNWEGTNALITGMKGYFQVWGLLITAYTFADEEDRAKRLMTYLLWLGVLQLPFVLHQYLVLIPLRSSEVDAAKGIVAGDIVAGTFGGSMQGGGRSSTLALLLALCIVFTLARYRVKQLSTHLTISLCILFFFPMLLSEAKLFLVLLPAGLFFLYRDEILRKPLHAAVGIASLLALLTLIFSAYTLIPGARSQQHSNSDSAWEDNVAYNIGDRGYGNAILNRTTVYSFWFSEHVRQRDVVGALVGHGLGATNGETILVTNSLAASRYRGYGIGLTGLSTTLWETGLLGTLILFSILVSAYRLGGRLSKRWAGTAHWPALKTAQIAIIFFALNFLHNNYFSFDLSYQTLFAVVIGYLLAMNRIGAPAQTRSQAHDQ